MMNKLTINDLKLLHTPEELKKCRIYDGANVINSIKSMESITFVERSLCEVMHKIIPENYNGVMVIFGNSIIEFSKTENSAIAFKLVEIYNSSNIHKKDMREVYKDMKKVATTFNKDPKICVLVARGQVVCGGVSNISVGPMTIGNNIDIQQAMTFDTYKEICMSQTDNSFVKPLIKACDNDFKTPFNFLRKSTSFDSIQFLDDPTKSFIIDWFKKDNPAKYSQEELDLISSDIDMRSIDILEDYLDKEELTEAEYDTCISHARNIVAFDQACIMFRVMMAIYTLFLLTCDKSGVSISTLKTEIIPVPQPKKKKGKVKKINIPIYRIEPVNGSMVGKFSIVSDPTLNNPSNCSLKFIGENIDAELPPETSEGFLSMLNMH